MYVMCGACSGRLTGRLEIRPLQVTMISDHCDQIIVLKNCNYDESSVREAHLAAAVV